ncbi:MAG: efflux RND transporter periplasmic adaptor subunit [Pseudomonadota bacterium]
MNLTSADNSIARPGALQRAYGAVVGAVRNKVMPVASVMLFGLAALPLQAAGPPPASVIVERVSLQLIGDSLEALGTLRANESVVITAKVSDTISVVHFEDGESVSAGDILAEQTDAEETALLQEAESLAEEAQRQFNRVAQLVTQGSASESLLDERRQLWRTAQARELAVRSRLKDRLIIAPFSGHVGLRQVSPGALVEPGDVITTLVDDSRMKLDFTIPAIYLSSVRIGGEVTATTPVFVGQTFTGTVTSVDSTIDPVTRSITVRAVLPNPDHKLVPGMLMTLKLLRDSRDAAVISEQTVIPRGNDTFVFVVDTDAEPVVAEQRAVVLGRRFAGKVEVRSGLQVGETVVSHGTLKVRPGAPLHIKAVDDGSRAIADMIRPEDSPSG